MDIVQYIFPFIMAVITNSMMIIIIYFLRKVPVFSVLSGVWSMVALYLLCVLRVLLPLEFAGTHIIIVEKTVFNALIDRLIVRHLDRTHSLNVLMIILLAVWAAVALIIGIIFAIRQKSFKTYILANTNEATDTERAALSRVAVKVLGSDKNISLYKTDAVDRIMVMGFFKRYVLLPDGEYASDQLDMILQHECMHVKNKDLWLKLMIQVYCCIFWWNPFSYLLKRDLSYALELRCDLGVVRSLSPYEVAIYLNTIHSSASAQTMGGKPRRSPFLISAELTDDRKRKELIKRVKAITSDPPKKAAAAAANLLAALVLLAVFVGSYLVIVQPYFGTDVPDEMIDVPESIVDPNSFQMIEESDAFLVRQDDGSYLLYIEGFPPVPVPKDEVDAGYYDEYPILENR